MLSEIIIIKTQLHLFLYTLLQKMLHIPTKETNYIINIDCNGIMIIIIITVDDQHQKNTFFKCEFTDF